MKTFCATKDRHYQEVKSNPQKLEAIFANHVSESSSISRIYYIKNSYRSITTQLKWAKYLNKLFLHRDIQRANKHMKICLASQTIRKM